MKAIIGGLIGLVLGVSASAEPLVEGWVRLDSGNPVAGAQVLLFDLTDLRSAPVNVVTDETGYFALTSGRALALPEQFGLGPNYPNPFNPSTIIPYQLPTSMQVRLEVFNILGQRVVTLVDGERPAGFHTAHWDATDAAGWAVAAGVYLYRLSSDGVHVTRSMVLIDGQAGAPMVGGPVAAVEEAVETAPIYGLAVSGEGLVPYVDPAFRGTVGRAPVDLVVETLDSAPRAKVASVGILGNVDNNTQVDFFDALLVTLYSRDASIVMPNNGDIALGDVNRDSRTDFTDVWLIAQYLNDPSDPALPLGIGETVDSSVQFAPSDEQTFNSRMVGNRLHAETFFIDFVSSGRFSESGSIPGSYQYSNTGPDTGTLTLTYDGGQYGGGCTLKLTFTSATTGTLHYTCNSGIEGRNNWHIADIGAPPAPQVVPRSSTDTELEVTFRDFFAAGETRAYDFQLRTKTPRESWRGVCNTLTNNASTSATITIALPIVNLKPGTVYEVRYRYKNSASCDSGSPGPWSEIGEGATSGGATNMRLEFPEGESTTRSIPENTLAGINVGAPVFAVGGDTLSTLTFTISGPDAWSFVIVPQTGQIRTREGVTYDYEEQNRYAVTVSVEDDNGNRDTIEVTIQVENLVPACELWNLRVNHSDQRLTVRWSPPPERDGQARVLGYETEIRRGESGPWTDRRTFLGRNINAMIYADLDNEIGYQIRARPINAEGDCGWSAPVWGIPTGVLTPRFPTDRFGTQPVGTPDRNWRFLTQERCRHTSNGVTLDANCEYENTGPNTGRIFLDFDDPSRGSCEITLVYSSLTAGSFIDECFDAGVNTEVLFDLSFTMPRLGPRTEGDLDLPPPATEPQRAPRNQDEFDALVYGRDDFIPGLCFGNCLFGDPPEIGVARRFVIEPNGDTSERYGDYTYENTGPSQGVLTFTEHNGSIWVFTLDFEPSNNVQVTITDANGDVTEWSGILYAVLTPRPQPKMLSTSEPQLPPPIQLPIPEVWKTFKDDIRKLTPETIEEFASVLNEAIDTDSVGDTRIVNDSHVVRLLVNRYLRSKVLFGEWLGEKLDETIADLVETEVNVGFKRLRDNRVIIDIKLNEKQLTDSDHVTGLFVAFHKVGAVSMLNNILKQAIDLNFSGILFTGFLFGKLYDWLLPSEVPIRQKNYLSQILWNYFLREMSGLRITYECSPTGNSVVYKCGQTESKKGEEPQAGYIPIDFSGNSIGFSEFPAESFLPDDPPQASGEDLSGVEVAAAITTPQIGANDVQTFLVNNTTATYSPGDWLEPKDGSNQRMMIVGAGQVAAAKPVVPSDVALPQLHQRILKMQSAASSRASPIFASAMALRANRASQSAYSTTSSTITQLSVVCMQRDRDIPTRGARYFSQPKTAQDEVQLCQQNCVLNETDNIQECVWNCGVNASED